MWHIIERFVIHFTASTFATLAVFFALSFATSRSNSLGRWVSSRWEHLLAESALLVFSFATLREPFDLYYGNQTVIKTVFDDLGWFLGPAFSVWGLYRLKMR